MNRARRKNYRVEAVGPQFPPLENPAVECPACGSTFRAREVAGDYLNRRCPACGALLDGDAYDARHHAEEARIADLRQLVAAAQRPHDRWLRWSQWAERMPRALAAPLKVLVGVPLRRSQSKLYEATQALDTAKAHARFLAHSRYYVSE